MNSRLRIAIGIATVVALGIFASCFYSIYPTDQVLLTQLGAPIAVITEPGLHFKIPIYQYANFIPRHLLTLETNNEEMITADNRRLVVSSVAQWRVVAPLKFYQSVPNGRTDRAAALFAPILSSSIRGVLGSQTFAAVLSQRREALMGDVRDGMNREMRSFGVEIADVHIRRVDMPAADSQAIYLRMQKEREREADEFRAEGEETAQRVRARAEREKTVVLAEATREADILRGQGDAERARILAEAYDQDRDFFAFYRSMQAYQDALKSDNTTLVLSPNGEFFKYLGAGGASGAKGKK